MIIYSKSFPGRNYRFDGPDDALYARSESGWIDSELFLSWMKKVFLRHCGSQRPIILFVDGHVKEAAELKQKRKEERELKKIEKENEREQKKKELEEKRRNKKERGKGKKRQRHSSSESGEQSVTGSENEDVNNHNRPSRRRCIRVPNRYRDENADSEVSDTECVICNA